MNSGSDSISSKQLVTLVISSQIGIGILTLPSKLAESVGHDGWISIIASGIICSGIIAVMMLLLKRYKNKSLIGINKILYGKYLGNLLNLYVIFYLFYTSSYLFRTLIGIVQQTTLYSTPVVVISLIIITPSFYLCTFGLKYICRYSILVYLVLAVTLFQFLLIGNKLNLTFLLPVGASGLPKLAQSLNTSVIALIGFELVAVIYPYITDKIKLLKKAQLANLATCIFYIIIVLVTTAMFGENFLKRLVYPLFTLSRTYRAPIFERLDLFYIALWFPAMAGSTRLYLYSTQLAFREFFNLKSKNIYLVVNVFLVIAFSRLPKNFMDLEKYADYLSYMALSILALILFSYLFSLITKRGL